MAVLGTGPGQRAGSLAIGEFRDLKVRSEAEKYQQKSNYKRINNTYRKMRTKKTKYLNPYIGGVLLGLVLLAANFVSGRDWEQAEQLKALVVTAVTLLLL